jgi:hypothetical protein
MPQPDGALSVFSTDNLEQRQVWGIGQSIATERNQNLHARGDIMTKAVIDQGLQVVRDEPPPRHRNIVGWPPATQKEDQKLIALELVAVAKLVLP